MHTSSNVTCINFKFKSCCFSKSVDFKTGDFMSICFILSKAAWQWLSQMFVNLANKVVRGATKNEGKFDKIVCSNHSLTEILWLPFCLSEYGSSHLYFDCLLLTLLNYITYGHLCLRKFTFCKIYYTFFPVIKRRHGSPSNTCPTHLNG